MAYWESRIDENIYQRLNLAKKKEKVQRGAVRGILEGGKRLETIKNYVLGFSEMGETIYQP